MNFKLVINHLEASKFTYTNSLNDLNSVLDKSIKCRDESDNLITDTVMLKEIFASSLSLKPLSVCNLTTPVSPEKRDPHNRNSSETNDQVDFLHNIFWFRKVFVSQ